MRKYYSIRFLEEMLKQVNENIGKQGQICQDNLVFNVNIEFAEISKTKQSVNVRVSPISGEGEDWVNAWHVIYPIPLDMDKLDTIYREDEAIRLGKV